MKKLITIIILIFALIQNGFTQDNEKVVDDSTKNANLLNLNGRLGPSLIFFDSLIEKGAFLLVNNILFTNKSQIFLFFKKYKNKYTGLKYYEKEDANKRLKIVNNAGIFLCRVKKIIVNLN